MGYPLKAYTQLLESLRGRGYVLGPVNEYFGDVTAPFVFLRHDVDRQLARAHAMAIAEHELGIRSTYYFRCNATQKFPEEVIRSVAKLGHEIGFHYETVVYCQGDMSQVTDRFQRELAALRQIVPVQTVAAHGSPLSKHTNMGHRALLRLDEQGILGDSREDMDFQRVFYVTDTGGKFGSKYNVRDWAEGRQLRIATSPIQLPYHLTPAQQPLVLLNTHPERWPANALAVWGVTAFDFAINLSKQYVIWQRRRAS